MKGKTWLKNLRAMKTKRNHLKGRAFLKMNNKILNYHRVKTT